MRLLLSVMMASVALLALAQRAVADDAAEKAELEKLKGAWVFESMTFMGETKEAPPGTEIVFEGNKVSQKMGGEAKTATFKLNVAANPKQIDMTDDGGPQKGTTELGIYELTGDQMRMCVAMGPPEADGNREVEPPKRPKAFDDKEGAIIVLKRKAQ